MPYVQKLHKCECGSKELGKLHNVKKEVTMNLVDHLLIF